MRNEFSDIFPKPQPILSKDSERREENGENEERIFRHFPKPQPILSKDSERRVVFSEKAVHLASPHAHTLVVFP